mgnify:CR=1 FL=1
MILQKDIISIAEEKGLTKSTIEKDWVLGHFLDAIYSDPGLRDSLIFKGGTCLKKCYFPDYRFSEDLDFTSINNDFTFTPDHLKLICNTVSERAGILTHTESILPLRFKDQLTGFEARIKFWGADHPRKIPAPDPERWSTRIKIEIILYELMVFQPDRRPIMHAYPDELSPSAGSINCYSIPEIMAEKMRALIQRSYTAPRDYYDIWYLANSVPGLNYPEIVDAFLKKLQFKQYEFSGIEQLLNPDADRSLRSAWERSLIHQIPKGDLPSFDLVKNHLQQLFTNMFQNRG